MKTSDTTIILTKRQAIEALKFYIEGMMDVNLGPYVIRGFRVTEHGGLVLELVNTHDEFVDFLRQLAEDKAKKP